MPPDGGNRAVAGTEDPAELTEPRRDKGASRPVGEGQHVRPNASVRERPFESYLEAAEQVTEAELSRGRVECWPCQPGLAVGTPVGNNHRLRNQRELGERLVGGDVTATRASARAVQEHQQSLRTGDRIEGVPRLGIKPRGTVYYPDDLQVLVKWDDGRSESLRSSFAERLRLINDEDR
jgi:hypothetical protein